jgi:A/G-specific adenine glycosylase
MPQPPAIARNLVNWYRASARDLPWRRTSDPYHILVSEVMLQQTRAQTVIPYYEKFLSRFPTVRALARASESEVLAAWSGLGYYTRARNLQRAAREIDEAGDFPREYDAIRKLPGVGPYTAAAVASIAFGLPHVVVDGNVLRVVARIANDASDIGASGTRARFEAIAAGWLDRGDPGGFNQALMELGATVCLPRDPLCLLCPAAAECAARAAGTAGSLPVKLRRTEPAHIASTLLLIEKKGDLLMWQRPETSSRMPGFWELPDLERLPGARAVATLGSFRHTITHHHYRFEVVRASISRTPKGFHWLSRRELEVQPLSTISRKALRFQM